MNLKYRNVITITYYLYSYDLKTNQITTTKHLLQFAEIVIQTEIMMTKQLNDGENKKRYKSSSTNVPSSGDITTWLSCLSL